MGWNNNNSKQSQFTTDCQTPQTDFPVFHLGKANESVLSTLIERALLQLDDQYAYTKQQSTIDALVKLATVIMQNPSNKTNIAVHALLIDFQRDVLPNATQSSCQKDFKPWHQPITSEVFIKFLHQTETGIYQYLLWISRLKNWAPPRNDHETPSMKRYW